MIANDKSMERIANALRNGNAGTSIAEFETYLAAWPQPRTSELLSDIKNDYRLMTNCWRNGTEDPTQAEQYQKVLQRIYVLAANVACHRRMQTTAFLKALYDGVRQAGRSWTMQSIRNTLEDFVSNVAMLELEPEDKRQAKSDELYKQHQQYVNELFHYIVTSRMWTDGAGRDFTDILLTPTIDSYDQQLLVSAVMLSMLNQFDIVKLRLLSDVALKSVDSEVRQRALVAWVFCTDSQWLPVYPEQKAMASTLVKAKNICRQLVELQQQIIFTLNAEKDTETMQNDIMPNLLKNNSFRITPKGIEEIEDDPLEDIVNPGAEEQRVEQVEASFRRMQEMQKHGADLFFGGFSQMKRFAFFYDIANWLVPFYTKHPDIAQFMKNISASKMMEKMATRSMFCNSDKYSFVIAFEHVERKLPENIREMMARGELEMAGMSEEDIPEQSETLTRRLYLMDLYRFFRLFPNRAVFTNPFDRENGVLGRSEFFSSEIYDGTPIEEHRTEIARLLTKQNHHAEAHRLLEKVPERLRDIQYHLLTGDYDAVLRLEPDNEQALAGQARELFEQELFTDAADEYDRLAMLFPEKRKYTLYKAVCLMHTANYDDALKLLYQLNYEDEDNITNNRVLAWTLTCAGRLENAAAMYERLTSSEEAVGEDFLNRGYCLWLTGKIDEAAESFRKYCERSGQQACDTDFFDVKWLQERGISITQTKMMVSLVDNLL